MLGENGVQAVVGSGGPGIGGDTDVVSGGGTGGEGDGQGGEGVLGGRILYQP